MKSHDMCSGLFELERGYPTHGSGCFGSLPTSAIFFGSSLLGLV